MSISKRDPLIRVRWFWYGVKEHRYTTGSGAHDYRAMDAYWAGKEFAWKMPRVIRRLFPKTGAKR